MVHFPARHGSPTLFFFARQALHVSSSSASDQRHAMKTVATSPRDALMHGMVVHRNGKRLQKTMDLIVINDDLR